MPILTGLLNILLVISSIFLICLVLIQRGKGGGLAGAFGGVGGSSAFGTKAGDVFTRVTIVTAVIWFVLAMMLVIVNNQERRVRLRPRHRHRQPDRRRTSRHRRGRRSRSQGQGRRQADAATLPAAATTTAPARRPRLRT